MEMITSFFSSIRWQDVVDVALNSYILFRLYVLFRGTTVFRVLTGIALLWIFQRIAVSIGLIVTSWAIQGIIAVAALIIIIVFRNEIRSVLQAKNLKAILWGFPHRQIHTPIEIIVESISELSRRHCGALIVIPEKEDIEDMIQSGVPWNGSISKEMLISIFWPGNPVHDGAVIIRGDRVTEVRVILPLSKRNDFPSSYGTRHRAAIGLAEATDALVLVVSEESGSVVMAKGSSVFNIRGKRELTQKMQEHLDVTTKYSSRRVKEKRQIALAALVSVVFVTGVWGSFSRGLETLITLEIPVEYINRDPGMEVFDTSINAVRLYLSGSGALIRSIRPEQVKVKLDLSKAVVGLNTLTIKNEDITLPPGVLLKRVEPSLIELTLDVLTEKELPIQVDWSGKLPEHLVLHGATLVPDKTRVIGGSQILKNISTLYTEKASLTNINKSGTITINLALNPASLKIAPGFDDRVTVSYVTKERLPF
jgi:diadenylate cyclase